MARRRALCHGEERSDEAIPSRGCVMARSEATKPSPRVVWGWLRRLRRLAMTEDRTRRLAMTEDRLRRLAMTEDRAAARRGRKVS
jgi:hypothetical protein